MCSSCRNNQNPQTVKLSPRSSGRNPTRPICETFKRRSRPNRPHIPSSSKFSKSAATKIDKVTSFLAHPRQPYLQILRAVAFASSRHRHVSASVRRYLRMGPASRKRKNACCRKIFAKHIFCTKSGAWRHDRHKSHNGGATIIPGKAARWRDSCRFSRLPAVRGPAIRTG
jgi:hypothetical protein